MRIGMSLVGRLLEQCSSAAHIFRDTLTIDEADADTTLCVGVPMRSELLEQLDRALFILGHTIAVEVANREFTRLVEWLALGGAPTLIHRLTAGARVMSLSDDDIMTFVSDEMYVDSIIIITTPKKF